LGGVQRGRFITFEGGEGTGKSTQARRLGDVLRARGVDVELTREPGGVPQAETLRSLLIEGDADRWSPVSETLLMYAARQEHLRKLVRPALEEGRWVVSDRFHDSTRAYQGAGGGAPAALIDSLEAQVVGQTVPDLTLVLDLPVELGLQRAAARSRMDRFEDMGRDFHERLREGFLDIAAAHPQRCTVIDASVDLESVATAVWAAVAGRLGLSR
jgi:dTMP kinase